MRFYCILRDRFGPWKTLDLIHRQLRHRRSACPYIGRALVEITRNFMINVFVFSSKEMAFTVIEKAFCAREYAWAQSNTTAQRAFVRIPKKVPTAAAVQIRKWHMKFEEGCSCRVKDTNDRQNPVKPSTILWNFICKILMRLNSLIWFFEQILQNCATILQNLQMFEFLHLTFMSKPCCCSTNYVQFHTPRVCSYSESDM